MELPTPFQQAAVQAQESQESPPGGRLRSSSNGPSAFLPHCIRVMGFNTSSSSSGSELLPSPRLGVAAMPPPSRQSSLGAQLRQQAGVPHRQLSIKTKAPRSTQQEHPRFALRKQATYPPSKGISQRGRPGTPLLVDPLAATVPAASRLRAVALARQCSSNMDIPTPQGRLRRAFTCPSDALPSSCPALSTAPGPWPFTTSPTSDTSTPSGCSSSRSGARSLAGAVKQAQVEAAAASVEALTLHTDLCERRKEVAELRELLAAVVLERDSLLRVLAGQPQGLGIEV